VNRNVKVSIGVASVMFAWVVGGITIAQTIPKDQFAPVGSEVMSKHLPRQNEAKPAGLTVSADQLYQVSPSTPGPMTAQKVKVYKNCKAMNKVYRHGVGKKGAKDKTSGKPVTNFKVSTKIYNANKARDRDGDKIACEKR
jgi:hypothetical protein